MTEFDEMRYCNKCLKNTIHLCSGSGNKSSCYKCGTDNKKTIEPNYKEAYFVLMEYWDSLPDDQKEEIDKQLNKLGV